MAGEDLPRIDTPREWKSTQRRIAAADNQIDVLQMLC
jgi:hypothetical protein